MIPNRYQSFIVVFVVGLLLHAGDALLAQEGGKGKEQQPAGRNAKSNSEADLENSATNYVERRKQLEGEVDRQRAMAIQQRGIAEQQKIEAEKQRQRAEQRAQEAERARDAAVVRTLTDTPKTMFAITIWVVRLKESDKNGESDKPKIEARTEFPTEFGSADSVRALINGLAESGRVRSTRELRLVALAGQQAHVQIGADKPQVSGVSVTGMGRSNSIIFRSIGTTVQVRPSIDSEKRIQVELEYNASYTEPSNDVTMFETNDGKSKIVPEMIALQQLQTTAKMKNGAAVMVKCDVNNNSGDKTLSRQTDLLILGCETVPAPE